ncbi:MAG: alpha/beta fold hydrolase [Halioglobus sp.]
MRYACAVLAVFVSAAFPASADCVVLLHGLARTATAMEPMADALASHGYAIANIDYPSREFPVETLAVTAVEEGIAACPEEGSIHFVTHSLGGILVRYYFEHHEIERLGRVVMLAPPNKGSEVVDDYRSVPGFALINGPAGQQLGTDGSSIPNSLGPVTFEAGVIAGSRSFNPLLSQSLPNPDDGKVSVDATRVEGMADFIVVPHSHPFIMSAESVMAQTLHFLQHGRFEHAAESAEREQEQLRQRNQETETQRVLTDTFPDNG